jgi:threonine dehydratase
MPSLISLSDIREAAERIRPIARTTPLVDASSAAGRPFFNK